MRRWVFGFLILAVTSCSILGQALETWSPPDKSFSIRVPSPLKEELDAYGEASDANAVKTFGLETSDLTFIVVILRYSDYRTQRTEEKFEGLFFVVGGDDDYDFSARNMKIDGMNAQEIAYRKQPNRGRFIDAKDMVIVLALRSKDKAKLNSRVANEFLNSFRLNRSVR